MSGNMTLAMLREYIRGDADEKILTYVAVNAHKVLYMSLEKLCERLGITEEQAKTFFHAFGSDSFVAFKYILRKCLYYERTAQGAAKRSLSSLSDECVRFSLQNLLHFSSTLDCDKVEQLAKEIWNAPEVNLLYSNPMHPLASALNYQLRQMKIRSHEYSLKETPDIIDTLSPNNLIIVFGFSRYSMQLLMQTKQLHQRGFRIACITDAPDSPFIPLSDYHFILANDSFDFLDSYVSGVTFIHTLILALGMQREDSLFLRLHDWDIRTQENNNFW